MIYVHNYAGLVYLFLGLILLSCSPTHQNNVEVDIINIRDNCVDAAIKEYVRLTNVNKNQ